MRLYFGSAVSSQLTHALRQRASTWPFLSHLAHLSSFLEQSLISWSGLPQQLHNLPLVQSATAWPVSPQLKQRFSRTGRSGSPSFFSRARHTSATCPFLPM